MLYIVVATFAASAVLAIGAAAPLRVRQLDVVSARAEFRESGAQNADSARAKVLSTRLEELGDLEWMNAMKARFLLGGICAQVVAAICLSAAVIVYLNG